MFVICVREGKLKTLIFISLFDIRSRVSSPCSAMHKELLIEPPTEVVQALNTSVSRYITFETSTNYHEPSISRIAS